MITFFRRALPLLDEGARRRALVVCVLMMFLATMEAAALLLIAPLMSILTSPNLVSTSRFVTYMNDLVGHVKPSALALDLGVATIILYVVKSVASTLTIRWAMSFSLQEEARLVRRLMRSYLRTPYREHLRVNSAERVRTLTAAIRAIFQQGFLSAFSAMGDSFSVVLLTVILFVASPLIAVVAVGYFGLIAFTYQYLTNRLLTKRAEKLHRDQATDFRTIHQALSAVKEIQIRGVEDAFTDEIYALRKGLIPAYRSMALVSSTPRYILELAMVGAAGTIALVAYSTESISTATAALGLFLVGGFRILAPLNKIIFGNAQAKAAMPSVEQVLSDLAKAEVLEQDMAVEASSTPDDPLSSPNSRPANGSGHLPRIEIDRLCFSYLPGVPVLTDVSFTIEPGESVGLVGGSGAGKSTLFDLILGVLAPDSGEIRIDGQPMARVKRRWQDTIGYVPQASVIFDDTVRANVALGLRRAEVSDDDVWKALRLSQMENEVGVLGDGIDTVLGEGGTRLSGGQRQRLGVARALFGDRRVLLFDEATSALDNETEHRLSQVLESLKGTVTTVIIAHRLSTVRRCDRILFLEGGRLAAQGTFAELNDSIPGFARLVELASLEAAKTGSGGGAGTGVPDLTDLTDLPGLPELPAMPDLPEITHEAEITEATGA